MKHKLFNFLLACLLALVATGTKAQGLEGIIVEEFHTVTAADKAVIDAQGGSYPIPVGAKVYRVFVDMAPNYKLNIVFASPETSPGNGISPNPFSVNTTTTFWNDDNFGSEVPGQTRRFDEGLLFDSYITINTTGIAGAAAGCGSNTQQFGVLRSADTDGDLTTCGVYPAFTGNDGNIPGTGPTIVYNLSASMNFDALTDNGSTFAFIDDAWATLPASTGVDPTGTNRVLIGQFTTDGVFSFQINVQLQTPTGGLETYVHTNAGPGEAVSPFLTYPQPQTPDCEGTPGGSALPGTACNDNNACTINDIYDVNCVCTGTFQDTDGDGTCDADDGCPNDPDKVAPGICGCGVSDVDANSNGVCDMLEGEPFVQLGVVEDSAGQIEFRLLPDGDFAGYVANTVVTVRWTTTAGVSVNGAAAVLVNPALSNVFGAVSFEGLSTNGIHSYATFATLGTDPLGGANAWTGGTEVPFFRVPFSNTSGACVDFEVVYDTFQDFQNLEWYISLNGQERDNGFIAGKEAVRSYPAAECVAGVTVTLDLLTGSATLDPVLVNANDLGACGSVGLALDRSTFDCADVGASTVLLTLSFASGTTSSCSTTVNVVSLLTASAGSYGPACSNGMAIALGGNPAGGVWTGIGVSGDQVNGYTFSPGAGTQTLTYTYTDTNGCSAQDQTTLTVNPAPVVICPADQTVTTGDPAFTLTGATPAGGAYSGNGVSAGDFFPALAGLGVHVITYTYSDPVTGCSGSCSFLITVVSPVQVNVRVWLEGAYDDVADRMSDELRFQGLVPTVQPYTAAPFSYPGGETVSSGVLGNSDPDNAIVDWVLVELRDHTTPSIVLARRAALVQRDGDVVDVDGSSPVAFATATPGTYHVAIRHRNHLGAMTLDGMALGPVPALVDFSSTLTATFGTDARKVLGQTLVLWSGNASVDNRLRYAGSANDRDAILVRIGGLVPSNTVFNVYDTTDTNLDGKVRYVGTDNDRDIILVNIGGAQVTAQRFEQLP